jgi:hypothetical protein
MKTKSPTESYIAHFGMDKIIEQNTQNHSGVNQRFFTVENWDKLTEEIIDAERRMHDEYYVLYHAQPCNWRVYQDVCHEITKLFLSKQRQEQTSQGDPEYYIRTTRTGIPETIDASTWLEKIRLSINVAEVKAELQKLEGAIVRTDGEGCDTEKMIDMLHMLVAKDDAIFCEFLFLYQHVLRAAMHHWDPSTSYPQLDVYYDEDKNILEEIPEGWRTSSETFCSKETIQNTEFNEDNPYPGDSWWFRGFDLKDILDTHLLESTQFQEDYLNYSQEDWSRFFRLLILEAGSKMKALNIFNLLYINDTLPEISSQLVSFNPSLFSNHQTPLAFTPRFLVATYSASILDQEEVFSNFLSEMKLSEEINEMEKAQEFIELVREEASSGYGQLFQMFVPRHTSLIDRITYPALAIGLPFDLNLSTSQVLSEYSSMIKRKVGCSIEIRGLLSLDGFLSPLSGIKTFRYMLESEEEKSGYENRLREWVRAHFESKF